VGAWWSRARIGGCVPRGWLARRSVSLAVGPQQPNLWRFAEVQRSVLRSAHGVVDAIRRDCGSVVRRREWRGTERKEASLRLAARVGTGPQASAECSDVLRRRPRRPLVWQRARDAG